MSLNNLLKAFFPLNILKPLVFIAYAILLIIIASSSIAPPAIFLSVILLFSITRSDYSKQGKEKNKDEKEIKEGKKQNKEEEKKEQNNDKIK